MRRLAAQKREEEQHVILREISLKIKKMSFEKCGTGGCSGVSALFYTGTRGDGFSDNVCGRRDALGGGTWKNGLPRKGEPHGD